MPVVATILKNTAGEAVVHLVGDGAHTITRSSLITKSVHPSTTTIGSPVVRVDIALGIVVGGAVTGPGIPGGTTVVSINQNDITLSANATVAGSYDLTFDSQVATNATLVISKIVSTSTAINSINRGVVRVANVGNANLRFDGFALTQNSNTDVACTLGAANSMMIVELKKANYGDGAHPYQSKPT